MNDYMPVKESQLYLFEDVPFYCKSTDNAYVLYKKSGEILPDARVSETRHPDLFIRSSDKDTAIKELFTHLNTHLERQSLLKDLGAVRTTLYRIVNEALENMGRQALSALPDTIEVLFKGYSNNTELLEALVKIRDTSNIAVEHTINVMILTFRFCFYHGIPENETKRLALSALIHDLGISQLDAPLMESDHRLTDEEFKNYQTHTTKGHNMILKQANFHAMVAVVALEHHERIDGSGYPGGRTNLSFESQLIGLLDSYEPLTYRDKTYRKARRPFDSLQLIKQEVMQGKFQTDLFKDLCACLTG